MMRMKRAAAVRPTCSSSRSLRLGPIARAAPHASRFMIISRRAYSTTIDPPASTISSPPPPSPSVPPPPSTPPSSSSLPLDDLPPIPASSPCFATSSLLRAPPPRHTFEEAWLVEMRKRNIGPAIELLAEHPDQTPGKWAAYESSFGFE